MTLTATKAPRAKPASSLPFQTEEERASLHAGLTEIDIISANMDQGFARMREITARIKEQLNARPDTDVATTDDDVQVTA